MTEVFDYAFGPRAGKARAGLHHAVGLRHDIGLGRDRPRADPRRASSSCAPPRSSPTRAHQQPRARSPTSTTAPARCTSACADGTLRARCAGARPARDGAARDPRRRRLHADQPPDDLPLGRCRASRCCAAAARGTTRAPRTDCRARRRDRGAHRARPACRDPTLGPNPFTPLAIDFYERALDDRRAHRRGRPPATPTTPGARNNPVTQSPIGQAHDRRLRRRALRGRACAARSAAATRSSSSSPPTGPTCASRRSRRARRASRRRSWATSCGPARRKFTAGCTGGDPSYQLLVVKDGIAGARVPGQQRRLHRCSFAVARRGPLPPAAQRGSTIEAVTSPIWLDADAPPEDFGDGCAAAARTRCALVVRRSLRVKSMRAACAARGYALRECRCAVRAARADASRRSPRAQRSCAASAHGRGCGSPVPANCAAPPPPRARDDRGARRRRPRHDRPGAPQGARAPLSGVRSRTCARGGSSSRLPAALR